MSFPTSPTNLETHKDGYGRLYEYTSAPNKWDLQSIGFPYEDLIIVPVTNTLQTGVVGTLYGEGLHIAFDWYGKIHSTSDDGDTWVLRHTNSPANNYGGGAYGNGRFVLVATYGFTIVSTDGITWAQHTQPSPASNMESIIFDGTQFVGVGYAANSIVTFTSADGITWTQQANQNIGSGQSVTDIGYNGAGRYVVAGFAGWGVPNKFYYSGDLINWTAVPTVENGYQSVQTIDHGNGIWAIAHSGTNHYYTSTDATSWTDRTYPNSETAYCVAFIKDRWVFASATSGDVYSSFDCINWTLAGTSSMISPRSFVDSDAPDGTFIIAASSGNLAVKGNFTPA
jgi:hypothetical protein